VGAMGKHAGLMRKKKREFHLEGIPLAKQNSRFVWEIIQLVKDKYKMTLY
jgi:hypothetical protein